MKAEISKRACCWTRSQETFTAPQTSAAGTTAALCSNLRCREVLRYCTISLAAKTTAVIQQSLALLWTPPEICSVQRAKVGAQAAVVELYTNSRPTES